MKFLTPEADDGNIEYKLTLSHHIDNEDRIEELASQMRYRIYEGNGEAYYYLGVEDDGSPTGISEQELEISLESLEKVAQVARARIKILRREQGNEGLIAELLIRREKDPEELPVDIRLASVGNVDAGKSSLIGVLLKGELDDGRGSARSKIFRYLHELESGRTSSVSTTVLGYDIDGNIVNHDHVHPPTDIELLERSIKTITFHDLAGHEKYLKTTIFGLTGLTPEFALLVVAANQGILQMTKEHLGLVISLNIPFFVVVTKIDLAPENITIQTKKELVKLLKIPGVSKIPFKVNTIDDAVIAALNLSTKSIVPIFSASSVTGEGIDFLKLFLQLLPAKKIQTEDYGLEFRAYIDDIFQVSGVGTVVAAMVYSGSIETQKNVQLGPFNDGSFREVRIKSIHYKRVPTKGIGAGLNATFALHNIRRDQVRKGMVLVTKNEIKNQAYFEFEAEIYVLYHSTTIRQGYSPVIHCRSIRQSAQMIKIDVNTLRTGDRAKVNFKFLYRPEYIRVGQRIIFREGRTKGLGVITKIIQN
ncbi:MAG: Elongation factor 1-alpha [Candidatus Heimdallarchaeota archaeon LC_2]|nr:MAG: Elongation factor 1-alpha [Candidatus Heimdallarchaeota archaeon LC_2]